MKTYNSIFKATSLLVLVCIGLASCNDWLTIYPQTQIVEENFWEDRNDLEGVRYAAYQKFSDQVGKMIVWGDLRSDAYLLNTQQSSDQGNRDKYRNMMQANIDTTWADYDWSGMYSCIGYCNKVLQHGEEVLERDRQFSQSEWIQMKAEMVTLRAMAYFYLVRAFKNIPYSTKVVNSDAEVEYFPQVPALKVMTEIINDVEKNAAGKARNRFTTKSDTKGLITNATIYALLSDMYLWKASLYEGRSINATASRADSDTDQGEGEGETSGEESGETDEPLDYRAQAITDYKACITYSRLAISKLKEQFEEEKKSMGSFRAGNYISWSGATKVADVDIDFMYKNTVNEANRGNVSMGAYNNIFNNGNSDESFFELQFSVSDSRENGTVNSMWGYFSKTHLVTSYSEEKKDDLRYWFSAWKNITGVTSAADFYCLKWLNTSIESISGTGENVEIKITAEEYKYNNWIIYRLSDVLLQEAEAAACLINLNENVDDNKQLCQQVLRMINRRWWVDVVNGGEPDTDVSSHKTMDAVNYSTLSASDYLTKVLETRKIEFIGEGKRWFDLVRYAERLSGNDDDIEGMRTMYNTFMNRITGYETTRNRCENLWGLYCPIYYMECKAYRAGGSNITQNPVWNKSKYDRK